MKESLRVLFEDLIKRVPHSESRVPYTYHHDLLRLRVFVNASRADIAQKKCWSDEELYASALVYLLDDLGSSFLLTLSDDDLKISKQAYEVCQKYIERLQEEVESPTKAFVICKNDSVKAVVLGSEERANEKKEELAKQEYDSTHSGVVSFIGRSYEEYRQVCFWHVHETKVL